LFSDRVRSSGIGPESFRRPREGVVVPDHVATKGKIGRSPRPLQPAAETSVIDMRRRAFASKGTWP